MSILYKVRDLLLDRPNRMKRRWIGWLGALLPALVIAGHCHAQSVLGYHGSPDRSGNFIVPALTWERAGSLHLDPSFHPQFPGHLYASRSIGSRRGRPWEC